MKDEENFYLIIFLLIVKHSLSSQHLRTKTTRMALSGVSIGIHKLTIFHLKIYVFMRLENENENRPEKLKKIQLYKRKLQTYGTHFC